MISNRIALLGHILRHSESLEHRVAFDYRRMPYRQLTRRGGKPESTGSVQWQKLSRGTLYQSSSIMSAIKLYELLFHSNTLYGLLGSPTWTCLSLWRDPPDASSLRGHEHFWCDHCDAEEVGFGVSGFGAKTVNRK